MTTGSVSQAGTEYLFRVNPGVEASQAGVEYLHRLQPGHAISQAGVEFLYKSSPCGTRRAQLWTITRTDGQVVRLTSLDRELDWREETYAACNSLLPSAAESVATVDDGGSINLSGAIASGAIDGWDLYAGLFDGAAIEAWVVGWDPSLTDDGVPKRLIGGTFGDVEQTETGFSVDIVGDGEKLKQTPLVQQLQPGCRWQFGDDGCGKDLGPLTVSGTIDSAEGLRDFTDAARSETAGYFTRGTVTFTSGDNSGVSAEIKEHEAGGVFTLWPRVPFPIAAGDTYSMVPGCTNLKAASGGCNGCTAWDNLLRYGGFDKVPGGDKRSAAAIQSSTS
jgi:uncharacterized phage protein (TIGR02218 family)